MLHLELGRVGVQLQELGAVRRRGEHLALEGWRWPAMVLAPRPSRDARPTVGRLHAEEAVAAAAAADEQEALPVALLLDQTTAVPARRARPCTGGSTT
eukprot:COSAG01_NODE_45221_length_411_cov_1.022436_2_plen_97_part_01